MNGLHLQSTAQLGSFALKVDLKLPSEGVTVLFGPSGSGKTTLLRAIAGLNQLSNTYVSLNEQTWQSETQLTPTHLRRLGMVFQTPRLFPHLNVERNLRFGMQRCATPATEAEFSELIELLGIQHLLTRLPEGLSGGEQQRVAIARALLMKPELLLMDEPLSALDANNKAEILPYLEELHQRLRIPVVYVTHDLFEMTRLGDHLVLLDQGAVRAAGPVNQLLTDPELPLASRSDALIQWDLPIVEQDAKYGICTLKLSEDSRFEFTCDRQTDALQRRVIIHARDVRLSDPACGQLALNQTKVRVDSFWPVGANHVHLRLTPAAAQGQGLIARISRKQADQLKIGQGHHLLASIETASLIGSRR